MSVPSHRTVCVSALSHFSRVQLFATPWAVAHQAPVSMRFSRKEYWSELPCPAPGDLPGVSLYLLHWQVGSLPLVLLGSPVIAYMLSRLRADSPGWLGSNPTLCDLTKLTSLCLRFLICKVGMIINNDTVILPIKIFVKIK